MKWDIIFELNIIEIIQLIFFIFILIISFCTSYNLFFEDKKRFVLNLIGFILYSSILSVLFTNWFFIWFFLFKDNLFNLSSASGFFGLQLIGSIFLSIFLFLIPSVFFILFIFKIDMNDIELENEMPAIIFGYMVFLPLFLGFSDNWGIMGYKKTTKFAQNIYTKIEKNINKKQEVVANKTKNGEKISDKVTEETNRSKQKAIIPSNTENKRKETTNSEESRTKVIINKSEYMIPSFPDIKNELNYQQGEDKGSDTGYKLEATAKSWREAAWSNCSNWEKAYNKMDNYNNEVKNLVNRAKAKFGYISWVSKLESFNQNATESFKNLFYAYCNMKNAYSNFDSAVRNSWSLISTKSEKEYALKSFVRAMEEGGAEWNRGVNYYNDFKRTFPIKKFNDVVDDWNNWEPN